MAITISGENNNDRILASDGVIDSLSGFNVVGVITATSFTGDLTGDVTGNLTGNVTGNINNTTLLLQTGGTERVRITSAGKVLIGTSTPQGNANADDLVISTSGHSGITIRSGTSSNGNIFFADGTSGADEYRGVIDYNHSSNHMSFSTNAVERLRITGDGSHLLLGGTSDVNEITESSGHAGMVIGGTSFGNAGLAIITSTSGAGRLYFGDAVGGNSGRNSGGIIYNHSENSLSFRTAGSARLILDSSGNLYPNVDNTQILGSSSKRWKKLHLGQGGEIQIGDATTSNFFGITEGIRDTYTDQDFLSIYFRNSLRFFSNNNNERIRIHDDGDLQLYNGNIIGNSSHTMEIGHITNGAVKKIRMSQGGEVHFGDTTTSNFMGITEGTVNQFSDVDYISIYYRNSLKFLSNNNNQRIQMDSSGNFHPIVNNTCNLGTTALRWANLYVNDLQLSNEAKKDEGGNDVDGTWGDWTLQEGENDIFMINKRNGKKFKVNMTEVS